MKEPLNFISKYGWLILIGVIFLGIGYSGLAIMSDMINGETCREFSKLLVQNSTDTGYVTHITYRAKVDGCEICWRKCIVMENSSSVVCRDVGCDDWQSYTVQEMCRPRECETTRIEGKSYLKSSVHNGNYGLLSQYLNKEVIE